MVKRNISNIILILSCFVGLNNCSSRLPEITMQQTDLHHLSFKNQQKPDWVLKLKSPCRDLRVVDNNSVLSSSFRGDLSIINLASGKYKKPIFQAGRSVAEILLLDKPNNKIFLSFPRDRHVIEYDFIKREKTWKRKIIGLEKEMVCLDDTLFAHRDHDEILKINKKNGDILFQKKLNYTISAGLFLYNNKIWVFTESGDLIAYNRNIQKTGTFRSDLNIYPNVIFEKGKFCCSDSKGLVSVFDLAKEEIIFKKEFKSKIFAPPCLTGNVLIVGFADGKVIAVNIVSGQQLWEYQGIGLINLPIISQGKNVFVPFTRGEILILDKLTGEKTSVFQTEKALKHYLLSPSGLVAVNDRRKMFFWSSQK